jgi:hypothetical protein
MNRTPIVSVKHGVSTWLSEVAQRRVWWMLVAFALLDWIHPMLALTQEWWCVLLVLWIVPWELPTSDSPVARAATWVSSVMLFAWLILRTEHAVRECLRSWMVFSSSAVSGPLSWLWQATIAAIVTSLVTFAPLRRVVDEPAAKPTAILACLPCSLLPALMMIALSSYQQRFDFGRERIPGYRYARTCGYRMLRGELNPCIVLLLFAGTWVTTLWLITSWFSAHESSTWPGAISLLCMVAFPGLLSALVLTAIAVWRSLGRIAHPNVITDNLRTLTRAGVVLLLLPTALSGFFFGLPYSGEALAEAMQRSSGPGWSIALSDTGTTIRISGEIRPGLSEALAGILETNQSVERLELESPGGSVHEGLALAELVERYSLDTQVDSYCDSACTLVFVTGAQRILKPAAELGFHRCHSVLWFDEWLYGDEHNAGVARYLISKGVSKAFAEKVISVSSEDMWYPSPDRLIEAGVVTAEPPPDGGASQQGPTA